MDYQNLVILPQGCSHFGDSELVELSGTYSTKGGDYQVMHCVHCGDYKTPITRDEKPQDNLGESDLEIELGEIPHKFLIPQ